MTVTTLPTGLHEGTWLVDLNHSEVGFSARHLGLSRVRGRFNNFKGELHLESDGTNKLVVTVEMASVDTNNRDRDSHLTTADFFNVAEFPEMTFRARGATREQLVGDLTIKGITKPLSLSLQFHGVASDNYETVRAAFSAIGSIKRSDFGIDFNAPFGLGGVLISDEIEFSIEAQLVEGS